MSNKGSSRKYRVIGLVVVLCILVFIAALAITLLYLEGVPRPSNNSATIYSTIFTIIAAALAFLGLSISFLQSASLHWRGKSPTSGEQREPTMTTGGISARYRLQAAEETSEELLTVEKQRLVLEKQKVELEREQQTIGWLKEALAVVQESPRSAIVIAWIGVEQELKRTARRPNLLSQPDESSILERFAVVKALNEAGYINQAELETLKRMQGVRNRIIHGAGENVPSAEEAIKYIYDAINITKRLASIEEKGTTA